MLRIKAKQNSNKLSSVMDIQEDDADHHDPSSLKKKALPAPRNKRKVQDADPCPAHNDPRTWGRCHANHFSEHNQNDFILIKKIKKTMTIRKKTAKSGLNQLAIHSSKRDKTRTTWTLCPSMDRSQMKRTLNN